MKGYNKTKIYIEAKQLCLSCVVTCVVCIYVSYAVRIKHWTHACNPLLRLQCGLGSEFTVSRVSVNMDIVSGYDRYLYVKPPHISHSLRLVDVIRRVYIIPVNLPISYPSMPRRWRPAVTVFINIAPVTRENLALYVTCMADMLTYHQWRRLRFRVLVKCKEKIPLWLIKYDISFVACQNDHFRVTSNKTTINSEPTLHHAERTTAEVIHF